jgi:hypothetical protein
MGLNPMSIFNPIYGNSALEIMLQRARTPSIAQRQRGFQTSKIASRWKIVYGAGTAESSPASDLAHTPSALPYTDLVLVFLHQCNSYGIWRKITCRTVKTRKAARQALRQGLLCTRSTLSARLASASLQVNHTAPKTKWIVI